MMRKNPIRNLSRDIGGSISVFMVCLMPALLALGGLAIDGANAWRTRAILQATADSASLAASIDLPDVAKAKASALTYAAKNMTAAANGAVLADNDIVTGKWDPDTKVFTPNGAPVNAVQVTVRRSSTNSNALPTSFLSIIGVKGWDVVTTSISTRAVNKLWVSLVLDNTGSMCQPGPTNPCPTPVSNSKIAALKIATNQLLDKLQNASVNAGDVMVSIVPFTKDVNVGTASVNAGWIDWTDWEAAPANSTPANFNRVGPGSTCPYTTGTQGFACQGTSANASSTVSNIPSSGGNSGLICPSVDNGKANAGRNGHYYNGCYNSVQTATIVTLCSGSSCSCSGFATTCSCTGSGSSKVCKQPTYNHTWTKNAHNTWGGCIMDRNQSYDVNATAPTGAATNFPSENATSCVQGTIAALSSNWTDLHNKTNAMQASGATNQTIGFSWGWQTMAQGAPMSPPEMAANTRRYIIILSDGFNTQNRITGDGATHSVAVDDRMSTACANAKAAGFTVYTVFVDFSGTDGNKVVLQNCATDSGKYFDLTTSGQIITTLDSIGDKIASHRMVY
jgi:Flp pilus assembly protein TadG